MVQSQFSLSWDSYKSSICNGFSSLQQNGEFVDMTLAADGHFVKVHQVLMALVSPYLKELIHSAPCQHPVIFLNNVSYKTLCCLLEYVYTGEVLVPSENLVSFVEAAKNLHIKGLEDFNNTETPTYKVADDLSHIGDSLQCRKSGIKWLAVPGDSRSGGQIGLPAAAKRVVLKYHKPTNTIISPKNEVKDISMESDSIMYTEVDNDFQNDSDDGYENHETSDNSRAKESSNKTAAASNLQFTVSIRGSLQVILNRYIYNLHSTAATGMRRWRCVEYRNHRCKAFIVTKDNLVLNRANLHNHAFHDKKILQKIEKKAVFSALDQIKDYKEKEAAAEKEAESGADEEPRFVTLRLDDGDGDVNWSLCSKTKDSN